MTFKELFEYTRMWVKLWKHEYHLDALVEGEKVAKERYDFAMNTIKDTIIDHMNHSEYPILELCRMAEYLGIDIT